jgi:hypothetical protein
MVTSRVAAMGAIFVVIGGGCALVADLGDDARLASADGGTAPPLPDATPGDDGSIDGGDAGGITRGVCGLPPAKKKACADCNQAKCCAESMACSGKKRCEEGIECLENCAFVFECVNACLDTYKDSAELNAMAECNGFKCQGACVPNDQCLALGDCCYRLNDAGAAFAESCVDKVWADDAPACGTFLAEREDAGHCP